MDPIIITNKNITKEEIIEINLYYNYIYFILIYYLEFI